MSRQSRKLEHLKYAFMLDDGPANAGFSDVKLVHNCIPELNSSTVDLTTSIAGLTLKHPVIINAVTGGASDVKEINAQLAEFARETQSAMAVGSQFAAIEKPEFEDTYSIVRTVNPQGVIFANIGAYATVDQAQQAIDMIKADGLQIHLNVAQEIMMAEGDRDFSGYVDNIAKIVANVDVPVIVKEVGFGIAYEQASILAQTGIGALDIGGMGGTNFFAIETLRKKVSLTVEELSWGIPTVVSTVEAATALQSNTDLIVSGGLRYPMDIVKALGLGGAAVGIVGMIIRMLRLKGLPQAINIFHQQLDDVKKYMLLLGCSKIKELSQAPLIICGDSKEWLDIRGFDTAQYAKRKRSS